MVRLSLSKVIVRLCSAPRTARAGWSSSASRATSISRSRSARKKRIRSGRSAGMGSAASNMSRISSSSRKSTSSSGSSAGRGRSGGGGVVTSSPEVAVEQGTQLGQAPAACGTDAADGHAEVGRHGRVVRARREGDDPQQFLASRGEHADRHPQRTSLIVRDDSLLRSRPMVRHLGEQFLLGRKLAPLRGAHPPRLPPGGGDQPAGECRRGTDVVQMRDQPHPGRLQDVLSVTRAQPGRARHVPEQRAEFGHDLAQRILAALPGRGTRSAMRAPRSGWLACVLTGSRSSTGTGLHPPLLLTQPRPFFLRVQFRQRSHHPGGGRSRPGVV